MRYISGQVRDGKEWRRQFAYFPTTVGYDPGGNRVKVWLEFYQWRYIMKDGNFYLKGNDYDKIERRPEIGNVAKTYKGLISNDAENINLAEETFE